MEITKKVLEGFTKDKRMIEASYNYLIENVIVDCIHDVQFHHSGGGCTHLFFLDTNGIIHSVHSGQEQIERSYQTWTNIDNYINAGEFEGFGWEHDQPNHESRIWDWSEFIAKDKRIKKAMNDSLKVIENYEEWRDENMPKSWNKMAYCSVQNGITLGQLIDVFNCLESRKICKEYTKDMMKIALRRSIHAK